KRVLLSRMSKNLPAWLTGLMIHHYDRIVSRWSWAIGRNSMALLVFAFWETGVTGLGHPRRVRISILGVFTIAVVVSFGGFRCELRSRQIVSEVHAESEKVAAVESCGL